MATLSKPKPSIHTAASLGRQCRRLDRRRSTVAAVIGAMKRGASLHLTYLKTGAEWSLSAGERVPDEIAAQVIRHPNVANCGGSLFGDHLRAQAYRFID